MLTFRMLIIFIIVLVSCSSSNSNTIVEGVYQSVSESEWVVIVSLLSGGKAEIRLENWQAGEYDKRDVRIIHGVWSKDDHKVIMKYNGITDVLNYTDNLSLSELGLEGDAPGLIQVPPIEEKSIIHGIRLWKKPHSFSKERS